jgi:citrate lyase subunit beta / citryl-CoA lyase
MNQEEITVANPMRSLLWVPGNLKAKITEALACHADCIVLDLEDTVPLSEKIVARNMVVEAIQTAKPGRKLIGVRINSWQSPFAVDDVKAVIKARPDIIRLPKCNAPEEMQKADKLMGEIEAEHGIPVGSTKVIVSIESALGLINAFPIAKSAKRIIGLGLGVEDYTTDLKTVRSTKGLEIELLYGRAHLVVAARAAGVMAIDGAFLDMQDEEGLRAETQLIKQLGFDGKGLVHTNQISVVHEVFAPTEKEVAFAQRVVQAFNQAGKEGSFYVFVDGKLVDPPVLAKAQRILDLSRA